MLATDFPQINLTSKERYEYFIQTVLETRFVWMIDDNGGSVTCRDSDNRSSLPVWPSKKYAELFLEDAWKDYACREVALHVFIGWLPLLSADAFYLTVCPNLRFDAYVVPAEKLEKDLKHFQHYH